MFQGEFTKTLIIINVLILIVLRENVLSALKKLGFCFEVLCLHNIFTRRCKMATNLSVKEND